MRGGRARARSVSRDNLPAYLTMYLTAASAASPCRGMSLHVAHDVKLRLTWRVSQFGHRRVHRLQSVMRHYNLFGLPVSCRTNPGPAEWPLVIVLGFRLFLVSGDDRYRPVFVFCAQNLKRPSPLLT